VPADLRHACLLYPKCVGLPVANDPQNKQVEERAMIADNLERARFNMVEQQVRPWDVLDPRVLEVISALPREAYVPEAYHKLAYADIEIPLVHGQKMLFPRIEGRMLQALQLGSGDRVLEIGTGSGYLTACLARLAGHVTSIELHTVIAEQAKANLEAQGVRNIELIQGDGLAESLEGGPFDAVLVGGSLPARNPALERRLKVGGRMVVAIGGAPVMEMCLITRKGESEWQCENLFETEIDPLEKAGAGGRFLF